MSQARTRTERTAFAASFVLHVAFAVAFVANVPPKTPAASETPLRVALASRPEPARATAHDPSPEPPRPARVPADARAPSRQPLAAPLSAAAPEAPVIRASDAPSAASAASDRAGAPAPLSSGATSAAAAPAPVQASAPVFDAAYLENPAPPYPRAARRGGHEGRVVLRVLVNPAGTADEVLVRTSSGHDSLDEAARATVARWRFAPARLGERAVAAWVLVPVSFHLDS